MLGSVLANDARPLSLGLYTDWGAFKVLMCQRRELLPDRVRQRQQRADFVLFQIVAETAGIILER
jgi:hypothetical protein